MIPPEFVELHKGSTKTSNWLLPGHIVMSSYPGDMLLDTARQKIRNFLEMDKVRTFVSLQEPDEMKRFRPYKDLVIEEAQKMGISTDHFEFLNFPIPDMGVQTDEKVHEFTNDLVDRVQNKNQVVLIHCFGGHGRTGTIGSILMTKLFPHLSVNEVLLRVALSHDSREDPRGFPAPQTRYQVEQVHRFAKEFR
ncbi:hypothetical protein C9374_010145 [Naegleria lovaniensis]|uniref:Tyrosine specific protein phosphatases domain-containing protein n=1 Tax=Naegleria lovaniensis TaxID=51637 RepID=A0AA88KGS0_NAELO|nr:uncharacterized protein C9374_010145 [Naegleria lovaniensis]KAG2375141.1 hypothetical protein C9374_010145 [Naegleria lovaniensis]